MTREEMLRQFQELCPTCYFCHAKHGGEGYDDLRMADVLSGIDKYIGYYLCPECQHRKTEIDEIFRAKGMRYRVASSLREKGLYDFDPKYRLSHVDPDLREANPELFSILDQYPLPSNLWEFGKCGIGKTHVLRAIANRYVYDLKSAAMLTGPQFRNIGEEFGMKREALLKPYGEVDLLIVDDIDKALKWTENSLEALWCIMNDRESTGRRTIVTSQVTPQKFFAGVERMIPGSDNFSLSILDRLKPLSVFEFHGRSRRGEA